MATLIDGPRKAPVTIALAHGAGTGMDTPFMATFAEGLADRGFRVVRFEFPYMAKRRASGKSSPPDREPVLRQSWLQVVQSLKSETLVIGGKSMGGRIASLVADEAKPRIARMRRVAPSPSLLPPLARALALVFRGARTVAKTTGSRIARGSSLPAANWGIRCFTGRHGVGYRAESSNCKVRAIQRQCK